MRLPPRTLTRSPRWLAPGRLPHHPADARRLLGVERASQRLLLGGVLPMWLGGGLADWYLHRRTHIQDTAGPHESLTHLLMSAETGLPVLLALFCEVNAATLAITYAGVAAHNATACWDQRYAEPRRRVSPEEQHVHTVLEASPVMAATLLTALHWDQALALLGRGDPDFGLRLKRRDPLSPAARRRLLVAVVLFAALPYAEELWRCWRATPTAAPLPEPEVPATETLGAPA